MDVSKLIVIWPNNVDSTRTIKKGRRIPQASGCEHPNPKYCSGTRLGGECSCSEWPCSRRQASAECPTIPAGLMGSVELTLLSGGVDITRFVFSFFLFFLLHFGPLAFWRRDQPSQRTTTVSVTICFDISNDTI